MVRQARNLSRKNNKQNKNQNQKSLRNLRNRKQQTGRQQQSKNNRKQQQQSKNNRRQQQKRQNKNRRLRGGNRSGLCLSSKNLDDGHLGTHGFHPKWDTRYCGNSGGGRRRRHRGGMALLTDIQPTGEVPTPKDVEAQSLPSQGEVGNEECSIFHDNMKDRTFEAKQPFWGASDL